MIGLPVTPDGALQLDLAAEGDWTLGFQRGADGKLLATTDTTGATMHAGFLRSPDGRLVVAEAAPVTLRAGLPVTASGALAVEQAAGTYVQGLPRTASGALAVDLAGGLTVYRATSFDAGAEAVSPFGFDTLNPNSGTITRDTTRSYGSSGASLKFTVPALTAGQTGIVRGNIFAPAGATVETDPLPANGLERWIAGKFWVRSGDTHTWTKILRLSDYGGPSGASVFEAVLTGTNLSVRVEDYQGSSGVANRTAHFTPWPRRDAWVDLAVRVVESADPAVGCSELWLDGVRVGEPVFGYTKKLAAHVYRRMQVGLCSYGAGSAEPAAEVWVDDVTLSSARIEP